MHPVLQHLQITYTDSRKALYIHLLRYRVVEKKKRPAPVDDANQHNPKPRKKRKLGGVPAH